VNVGEESAVVKKGGWTGGGRRKLSVALLGKGKGVGDNYLRSLAVVRGLREVSRLKAGVGIAAG
jgi:hypothetical protein